MKLQVTNGDALASPCQVHVTDTFPKIGTLALCGRCGYLIVCLGTIRVGKVGKYWDTVEFQEKHITGYVDVDKAILQD